jgi:hypothetical protein
VVREQAGTRFLDNEDLAHVHEVDISQAFTAAGASKVRSPHRRLALHDRPQIHPMHRGEREVRKVNRGLVSVAVAAMVLVGCSSGAGTRSNGTGGSGDQVAGDRGFSPVSIIGIPQVIGWVGCG